MRYSKEGLAKLIVELIETVCNNYESGIECRKNCPLYQDCEFWTETKLEITDWLNEKGVE